MTIKLEFYEGGKTFMYPNGKIATPEVIEADFPAISLFPHVIEVNGNVLQAVLEFESFKNSRGVTEEDNELALAELEGMINNPQPAASIPTSEERIAAALEFNNLLNMGGM